MGPFCPPGSRSRFRIRIRIQWPVIESGSNPDPDPVTCDWIRTESGSEKHCQQHFLNQFFSTVEVSLGKTSQNVILVSCYRRIRREKNSHLAEIFRVSDSWLCSFLTLPRVVDPHWFNADPDPDPVSNSGFLRKIYSWKKKLVFFDKKCNLIISRPP